MADQRKPPTQATDDAGKACSAAIGEWIGRFITFWLMLHLFGVPTHFIIFGHYIR